MIRQLWQTLRSPLRPSSRLSSERCAAATDLFLSYNALDIQAVREVRRLMEERGTKSFLDRENLTAGTPWPRALEEALSEVTAVAVFLGPHGLGGWQRREMWLALVRQKQEEKEGRRFSVIPVLLPGADPAPGFLSLNTWVDLRHGLNNPEALEAIDMAVGLEGACRTEATQALCPYRGLSAFREDDAAFFFGREDFAQRLLDKVLSDQLVTVVGSSGSGKSSLVHAGLLPLLRRQRLPARAWDIVSFCPGDRPHHRLAAALMPLIEPTMSKIDHLTEAKKLGDRLAKGDLLLEDVVACLLLNSGGTDRLLVVVDQFEELLAPKAGHHGVPFIQSLLQAGDRSRMSILLTLRADYYGHAVAISRDLSDKIERGIINIATLNLHELEQAIVAPARLLRRSFEPGLPQRILNDVGGAPGNLPLLEFALTQLWEMADAGSLTHAAYERIGGVAGAIAQRAEVEYARLTAAQQEIVPGILRRLVRVARPDEGGEDSRQRTVLGSFDPTALPVLHALIDARLLVGGRDESTGEETVEIAHEALIRSWSRLEKWLNEDREFMLWHQRVHTALAEWRRAGADDSALLQGALLTEAERWVDGRQRDIAAHELAFVVESRERQTERQAKEERQRELLALIAHDLRNPLAVIQGYAGVLKRRNLSPADRQIVDAISTNAKQMNAMITDLLDGMRLDSDRLGLEPRPIDLRSLVQALKARMLGVGGERIVITAPADLPRVLADPDRLERILMNLIHNALRYSEPATDVTVDLQLADGPVVVAVADRGDGIAPDVLPHLFERFYRKPTAANRQAGLGLGLYIAKALVEMTGDGSGWRVK